MHEAYRSDDELCKWLRDNSSGAYRLSGFAAERIETLTDHLSNVNHACDVLDEKFDKQAKELEAANKRIEELREAVKSAYFEGASDDRDTHSQFTFDSLWADSSSIGEYSK